MTMRNPALDRVGDELRRHETGPAELAALTDDFLTNIHSPLGSGRPFDIPCSLGDLRAYFTEGPGLPFVQGPLTSTDNAIPRFNGTDGNVLKDGPVILDDSGAFYQNTADGTDNKALTLAGGGAATAARGASLLLAGNENVANPGRFQLMAGASSTTNYIIGGTASLLIYNGTADGSDTGSVQIAGGGGVSNQARGAYLNLQGNENASAGQFLIQSGDASTLNRIIGGNVSNTALYIYNGTTDGADFGVLYLAGGGNANSSGRGAYLTFYGNEHPSFPGRFMFSAGVTATTSSIIGGGGAAPVLNIFNGTADGTDDGALLLAGGGAVGNNGRGAYLTLYGNENASVPGGVSLVAGTSAGSGAVNILGGASPAASITIRQQHAAGGNDTGVLQISGSGNINDSSRGSFISSYGNNHASNPGRLYLASGTAATFMDIVGGGGTNALLQIRNQTVDGTDNGSVQIAGGGAVNSAGRGAYLNLYGNEYGSGLAGRFILSAGDGANLAQIIGPGVANSNLIIGAGTVDGTDNASVQLSGGGGSTAQNTRGASLVLYGNEHASLPGRLQLVSGLTSAFTQILGGAAASTQFVISNQTADGADSGLIQIGGGGAVGISRGAVLNLYGNEGASPGSFNLSGGDTSTANYIIGGAASGSAINIRNNTADGSDSGLIQIASGGAVSDAGRGAYINIYGNDHATYPGMWQMVAGIASTQVYLLGGGAANTIMRIANQTPDGSDSGQIQIGAGGAANDVNRGAYIHLHGNEHATQPGHLLLVAGAAASPGQVKIVSSLLLLAAGTTGRASANIPLGAAPSSPVDGDIWLEANTTTGLKIRLGGVTRTFTLT